MAANKAVVIGAGIQGTCAALSLASAGYDVTVIDRCKEGFSRASLRNEGKIHLGFVYAKDESCRTSDLMLDAAIHFAPLLERWLGGPIDWEPLRSRTFTYVIAAQGMLGAEAILAAYARLQRRYEETEAYRSLHYFGRRPAELWRPEPDPAAGRCVDGEFASRFVSTEEVALELGAFRKVLVDGLDHQPRIQLHRSREVHEIERSSRGFRLDGSSQLSGRWSLECDLVINCAWEGRLALDRAMGIIPTRPWVYRLKHRLLGTAAPELADCPSMTFVLGPYGDVVLYPNGRVYLSWYPTCMRGWSSEVAPPEEWEAACSGRMTPQERQAVVEESLSEFGAIVPAVRDCRIDTVDAGVIFSWGATDIDDSRSELHQRSDIGVHEHDGYFSIDTGKFTCAPLFAEALVQRLR